MGDSVAKRAVRETREMTRLAVDAAKNELVEELAPAIRSLIERRLREGSLGEDAEQLSDEGVNRMRQAKDGYGGISDFEEGIEMKKKKDLKDESITGLFPSISEALGDEDEDMAEARGADEEDMAEAAPPVTEEADEDDEDMAEDIEISESELASMYKEALQLEVEVKKGFGDMEKAKDMGGTDPLKAHALEDPSNVTPHVSGDHPWEDELPPHKKNHIPETVQRLIKAGIAENRALVSENKKLAEMVRKLHGKLSEMNLFNSKILHVNRFMTRHKLTTEQKRAVVESLDRAASISEVRRIYSVLETSFKAAGAVNESRRPRMSADRRSPVAPIDKKVLRESADKAQGGNFARWKQLAFEKSGT